MVAPLTLIPAARSTNFGRCRHIACSLCWLNKGFCQLMRCDANAFQKGVLDFLVATSLHRSSVCSPALTFADPGCRSEEVLRVSLLPLLAL